MIKQIEANVARLQSKDETEREDLKVQTKRLYVRAALIELICAESMCIRPQLNDKL